MSHFLKKRKSLVFAISFLWVIGMPHLHSSISIKEARAANPAVYQVVKYIFNLFSIGLDIAKYYQKKEALETQKLKIQSLVKKNKVLARHNRRMSNILEKSLHKQSRQLHKISQQLDQHKKLLKQLHHKLDVQVQNINAILKRMEIRQIRTSLQTGITLLDSGNALDRANGIRELMKAWYHSKNLRRRLKGVQRVSFDLLALHVGLAYKSALKEHRTTLFQRYKKPIERFLVKQIIFNLARYPLVLPSKKYNVYVKRKALLGKLQILFKKHIESATYHKDGRWKRVLFHRTPGAEQAVAWHKSGARAVEGILRHKVREGLWKLWDSKGRKREETLYNSGAVHTKILYQQKGALSKVTLMVLSPKNQKKLVRTWYTQGQFQKIWRKSEQTCPEKNNKACIYWDFCRSDHQHSCHELGLLYEEGKTLKQDFKKAMTYFKRACSLRYSSACTNAGFLYQVGKMGQKDIAQAQTYYAQACSLDCHTGCWNLATLLRYDIGTKKSLLQALTVYQKSCRLGNKTACFDLAAYFHNPGESKRGYTKAKTFYKKACELEDKRSCYELGILSLKNDKKALVYLKRACFLAYPKSCGYLGSVYEYGWGVKRDCSRARMFYQRACQLGEKRFCKVKCRGSEKKK